MARITLSWVVSTTVAAGLASGCLPSLLGNVSRNANVNLPASFDRTGPAQDVPAIKATSEAQKTWDEFFSSKDLRSLINTALRNNQELNIRLQEIIISRNEVTARQGEYLPQLNAGAGSGLEKVGKYTSQGASDEDHGLPENLGNFSFGLNGSWEIDIWNKLQNAARAAHSRYFATAEARHFVMTELIAELARSYYELITLDNQLDILRRNIEIQANALDVVKLLKRAGRTTKLAVQRFEAELLRNRSRQFDIEQQRVVLENRINFLVGRWPQAVSRKPLDLQQPPLELLQTGLPAQLLENRPDVRGAALELEAARLDVKAAKAAFYPAVKIDAGLGFRAFNPLHLLAPESLMYGLAGSISAPLLNRSGITAQYRTANALQIQAVYNYEKTVLQAFTDVANQIALHDNLKRAYELQSKQVETLAAAVETSGVLFQSARADYMEVLLTRRDSLDAEMELVELRKGQFQVMVSIYQSLGGGWRPDQDARKEGRPP